MKLQISLEKICKKGENCMYLFVLFLIYRQLKYNEKIVLKIANYLRNFFLELIVKYILPSVLSLPSRRLSFFSFLV